MSQWSRSSRRGRLEERVLHARHRLLHHLHGGVGALVLEEVGQTYFASLTSATSTTRPSARGGVEREDVGDVALALAEPRGVVVEEVPPRTPPGAELVVGGSGSGPRR